MTDGRVSTPADAMAADRIDELTCQQVVELVTSYLEGALPPEQADLFEQHLVWCPPCEVYVEQIRMTIELTGRIDADELPPETQAALLDAFREWGRR